MSANVVVETRDRVTRIELARIDKKNALTQDMYAAIGQALSAAEADPMHPEIHTGTDIIVIIEPTAP